MAKPLIFQSKLFCCSFVYLFSSLFFAIHFSFSSTKCFFRSSPFDPIQSPLFSYPSSYGEHKYAISTTRSSCDSPVYFSDYWSVLNEIRELCGNSTTLGARNLKYLRADAETFGGNFSVGQRRSYLDYGDGGMEIPCGFFTSFPISRYDQISLEKCDGLVVVSAVFNDHDKIRQPKGIGSKTLDHVCFFMFVDDITLKSLDFHNLVSRKSKGFSIGAWRIIKVSREELYQNAAMNGIVPKYLVHRLFPNSKYSIWIDAKLQLMVDPLLLIHSLVVKEKVDMAISKHPYFLHTMEEAMATARWKKLSDVYGLRTQMGTYCENGLQPWSSNKLYPTDVPDSGLILRKHSVATNLFSCLLFNELEAFNPRDQLPFAYVRDNMRPKLNLNMFDVEVFEQVAVEYRHSLKQGEDSHGSNINWATSDSFVINDSSSSKCEGYLLNMWGETHD